MASGGRTSTWTSSGAGLRKDALVTPVARPVACPCLLVSPSNALSEHACSIHSQDMNFAKFQHGQCWNPSTLVVEPAWAASEDRPALQSSASPAAGFDADNQKHRCCGRYFMAWFAFYVLRGSDAGAGAGGRGGPGFGGPGTVPSLTGSVLRVRSSVMPRACSAPDCWQSPRTLRRCPAAQQVPVLLLACSAIACRWMVVMHPELRSRLEASSTVAEPRLVSAQAAGSLRLPRHGDAEPHRNPFLQLLRAYLDAYLPRPGASPAAGGVCARGYEVILAVPRLQARAVSGACTPRLGSRHGQDCAESQISASCLRSLSAVACRALSCWAAAFSRAATSCMVLTPFVALIQRQAKQRRAGGSAAAAAAPKQTWGRCSTASWWSSGSRTRTSRCPPPPHRLRLVESLDRAANTPLWTGQLCRQGTYSDGLDPRRIVIGQLAQSGLLSKNVSTPHG